MLRSRAHSRVLIAAVLGALAFADAGCGSSSPEAQLLNNFFRAARVRDNTTLANIGAVSFNPRTEGTVEDFEVVNVGAERAVAVDIKSLLDEEAKAKAEEEAFSRRRIEFQTANKDALQRVAKAESARQEVRGPDAAVLASLTKWREEQAQHSRRLSDVRARLARERSLVVNSLTSPGQADVDISGLADLQVITKQVTVNAEVRTPEGQTTPRTFVFTFSRAIGTQAGTPREGRWMITALQMQPVAQVSALRDL
jgi:hypothetical protein